MAKRQRQRGFQDKTGKSIGRPSRLIAVLMPTMDVVYSDFAHDMAVSLAYHMAKNPEDQLVPVTAKGTALPKMRNTLAQDAINMDADWTIWLDSDMRFPADTIARLLESGNDVVTVNAPKRKEPIGSTAHIYNPITNRMDKLPIDPSGEIVQIGSCGFAVAAIRTEVFRRVPGPWFHTPYLEDINQIIGEDIYFSSKLGQAGIKLHCDLELSEEVGHTGLKDYYLADARMWRDIKKAEEEEQRS